MECPTLSLSWCNCYRFQFDVGLENIKTGWKNVDLSRLERITRIIVGFLELFPVVTIPLAVLDTKYFFKNRLKTQEQKENPLTVDSKEPPVNVEKSDVTILSAGKSKEPEKLKEEKIDRIDTLKKVEENQKTTWIKIAAIVLLIIFTGGIISKVYNNYNSLDVDSDNNEKDQAGSSNPVSPQISTPGNNIIPANTDVEETPITTNTINVQYTNSSCQPDLSGTLINPDNNSSKWENWAKAKPIDEGGEEDEKIVIVGSSDGGKSPNEKKIDAKFFI